MSRYTRSLAATLLVSFTVSGFAEEQVLLFGSSGGVRTQAIELPAAEPMVLAAKTGERADFVSRAEGCWASTGRMDDGRTYTWLDLPGRSASGSIGSPRLPRHGRFVRIPDGAAVRLVVDDVTWESLEGSYVVAPAQPPTPLGGTPRFAKNPDAYARDAWTHDAPVRIADRARIRGRDVLYIAYDPLAYNPARSALRAATRVRWHLEFETDSATATRPRTDPVGAAAFAPLFEKTLDATVASEMATAAEPPVTADAGADYLVITTDAFADAVAPLLALKRNMGLTTRTVTLSEIGESADANDITAFLRTAYLTWARPPTYLLIVGDAEHVPPHDERTHPERPGMPATDLYYAAVDGPDILPDLFYGRISCSSAAEGRAMIEKITNHQVAPCGDADYRNTTFIPGMYQDLWLDKDGKPISANGKEGMRFMETAEALKNYLEFKGGTVITAYTVDTEVVPRHYDPGKSIYHEDGSLYNGTQEYLSQAGAEARTRQTMNSGTALVSYHAHGNENGWQYMGVSDVAAMSNGTRLPVVISMTCLTGGFDWPNGPCFAEALLRKPDGGAAAVIACTRVAYETDMDWTRMGFQESLWPDYLETVTSLPGYTEPLSYGDNPVGRSPRLGQALNFAKMFFYDKVGGSQEAARYGFEIYMLFGDPHMHFQTWNDLRISFSHPLLVSGRYAEFTAVARDSSGQPLPGATVRITSPQGDDQTYTTDASGEVRVTIAPFSTDVLAVLVTKAGMVPYSGTIELTLDPIVVEHPDSVSAVIANFEVRAFTTSGVPISNATVLASSEAGDLRQRTTDAAGRASFSMAPKSITTMDITVTARAHQIYRGVIQMIPGKLSVSHEDAVDEGMPFTVSVGTAGQPFEGARVLVTGEDGSVVGDLLTPGDGIARFPQAPAGDVSLSVVTSARGYTPVESGIQTTPGFFKWDSLPVQLDAGGPRRARVTLTSALDGVSPIVTYAGTAELDAVGSPEAPPPVVFTDLRIGAWQSLVILECVKPTGHADLRGWMLVAGGSTNNINAVNPDIRDPDIVLQALLDRITFNSVLPPVNNHWAPMIDWHSSRPGWVMLLDASTNIVDLVVWGWSAEDVATMAPTIRGRVVPVGRQWIGDGVPTTATLNTLHRYRVPAPQDHNSAEDIALRVYSNPMSSFTVPFAPCGPVLRSSPVTLGPFVDGVWTGQVAVLDTATGVVFRATEDPRSGDSSPFNVVQPPHVRYAFDAFPTQQLWNAAFPVVVRAQDKYGNTMLDFGGTARLYGFAPAPAREVLITELGISSTTANFVELHNLSGASADVRGWRLAIGDSTGSVTRVSVVVPLPDAALRAGEILSVVETTSHSAPFPIPIAWNMNAPGWAMLLDDSDQVADFVAWGWPESSLTGMVVRFDDRKITLGPAWVGPGIGKPPTRAVGTLQRWGALDCNRAGDFRWWTVSSRGAANMGLTVPLLESRRPVSIEPVAVGPFAAGIGSVDVRVLEDVDGMYLEARDDLARTGSSGRFNVRYLGELSVTAPALVREGDGVLSRQGTVILPESGRLSTLVLLESSDPSEITVPSSVTVLAGATSRTFDVTVEDDTLVDFTRRARITARLAGYLDGHADMGVQDNEGCLVALTVPAATHEGAGLLSNSGRIELNVPAGEPLVFRLTSLNTGELVVPPSVVLDAGRTRASFSLTVVDDAVADGAQAARVVVTPDDTLFKTGTVSVIDNDAHHFWIGAVPSPQTACAPFDVSIEARDPADARLMHYQKTATLDAVAGSETLALSPAAPLAFVNGSWTGRVSVLRPERNVELEARDATGLGRSPPFDVTHGPFDHFQWTSFPTGFVHAGACLPVRLQACDTNGFAVENYAGPVRIEATQHDPEHPVRVLTFVRYAREAPELASIRAALDTHLGCWRETRTANTNAVDVGQELARTDVFLLPPQHLATPDRLSELGGVWEAELVRFVERGGVVIGCSGAKDEHLLLRTAGLAALSREGVGSSLSPYVGLLTAATNALTRGVPPAFGGLDMLGFSSVECSPIVRSASNGVQVVSHRALGDGHVVMIGNSFAEPNDNLNRILANAVRLGLHRVPRLVPFAPEETGLFTAGVWTGIVQISSTGLDTEVAADDGTGHRACVGFFDMAPLRMRGVGVDAPNRLVLEWDSAGVTPYQLERAVGNPRSPFELLPETVPATPPLNTQTIKDEDSPVFYRLYVAPLR